MKFTQKKIVYCLILLTGILLGYHLYSAHSTITVTTELTSENTSDSNISNSVSEIHEEDQTIDKCEFLSANGIAQKTPLFQNCGRIDQIYFAVWQPPRIN